MYNSVQTISSYCDSSALLCITLISLQFALYTECNFSLNLLVTSPHRNGFN